jgi:NADH:ubiquinone oxidoreductase subunit 6 (subunit J)
MGGWIYTIAFYACSLILVVAALGVLLLRNLFHAGLSLIAALFTMAALFILLGAEFVAGIQVLIYVGAIAVLILFAVMLTQRIAEAKAKRFTRALIPGLAVALALVVVMILVATGLTGYGFTPFATEDTVGDIGQVLLSTYVLPFEVISLLLLGALVGAIVLARKEEEK